MRWPNKFIQKWSLWINNLINYNINIWIQCKAPNEQWLQRKILKSREEFLNFNSIQNFRSNIRNIIDRIKNLKSFSFKFHCRVRTCNSEISLKTRASFLLVVIDLLFIVLINGELLLTFLNNAWISDVLSPLFSFQRAWILGYTTIFVVFSRLNRFLDTRTLHNVP